MKKPADQQRNAERIPLTKPIECTIETADAHIVELSLIGARIEHFNRLSMNSSATVQFRWNNKPIKLKGKVARTEMLPIRGKPGYMSGVTFAATPEEGPQELRWIMSTFVESIEPDAEIAAPPPPPPPPPPAPKAAAPKPAPPKPAPPKATPARTEPIKATMAAAKAAPTAKRTPTPPPMPAPFLTLDDEVEEIDAGDEVSPYVRCEYLEDGGWEKTPTDDPKQPISGFTMLTPDVDSEVDDFCRTYEMADPETQRMIRLSFELGIAQFRRK